MLNSLEATSEIYKITKNLQIKNTPWKVKISKIPNYTIPAFWILIIALPIGSLFIAAKEISSINRDHQFCRDREKLDSCVLNPYLKKSLLQNYIDTILNLIPILITTAGLYGLVNILKYLDKNHLSKLVNSIEENIDALSDIQSKITLYPNSKMTSSENDCLLNIVDTLIKIDFSHQSENPEYGKVKLLYEKNIGDINNTTLDILNSKTNTSTSSIIGLLE
jgi:hypothetical protein